MTLDDLTAAESPADRTARLRAQRLGQPAPMIPAVGTKAYLHYRGSMRPAASAPAQPVRPMREVTPASIAIPSLDLAPECPITGNRYANKVEWIQALWATGILDTVSIAEIVGHRTTEAEVCRALCRRARRSSSRAAAGAL